MKRRLWIAGLMALSAALMHAHFTAAQEAGPRAEAAGSSASTPAAQSPASALDEAPNVPAEARESFTTIVVAGLPPVMSDAFEDLARRFGERMGVGVQPLWWRLDMAAFSTATPVKAAAAATALGLAVISDVSENLILAPEATPDAIKAEARLFLWHIADVIAGRGIWRGALRPEMANYALPCGWRLAYAQQNQGRRQNLMPGDYELVNDNGRREALGRLFQLNGPLQDAKVMAALNLVAADLDWPLRHFDLSDFTVAHRYGNRVNPGGRRMQPTRINESALVLRVREGQPLKPPAERADMLRVFPSSAPLWWLEMFGPDRIGRLMRNFGGLGRLVGMSSVSFSSGQPAGEPAQTVDNPYFVALQLDGFTVMESASREQMGDLVHALTALRTDESTATLRADIVRELLLMGERTCVPGRTCWVDAAAIGHTRDRVDQRALARGAKRTLAERGLEVVRRYVSAKGADAKLVYGRLKEYSVRREYGYANYGHFDVAPYDGNSLEFAADETQPLARTLLMRTVTGVKPEFSVRLDPQAGTLTWVKGEPESEELAAARREELTKAMELLYQALEEGAKGDKAVAPGDEVFGIAWVQQVFRAGGFTPKFTSAGDYSAQRILPGIVRLSGETSGGEARQALVVDAEQGRVYWETRRKEILAVPSDGPDMFEEK